MRAQNNIQDANYDLANKDSRKVLSQCRLDLFEFFQKRNIALFLMLGTFHLFTAF